VAVVANFEKFAAVGYLDFMVFAITVREASVLETTWLI
jgi:hypothetical protein